MNSIRKRRITAIVTLSVMLIATVAAVGILCAPDASSGGGAVVAPSAYNMGKVQYSKDNTSIAFVNLASDGNAGYARILFPNAIYLDVSESLSDAGYYIAYDLYADAKNGSNDAVGVYDTVLGYFGGKYTDGSGNEQTLGDISAPNSSSAGYMMHNIFSNYRPGVREDVSKVDANAYGSYAEDGNTQNTIFIVEKQATRMTYKTYLTGTVSSAYRTEEKRLQTHTFAVESGRTLAYTRWYGYEFPSGTKWRNLYFNNSFSMPDKQDNFNAIPEVAGAPYKNNMSFNIYIYDKSELDFKVREFENRIRVTDYSMLTSLDGGGAYSRAEAFIKDIRDNYLETREVTQKQIDEKVDAINEYVYRLTKPNDKFAGGKTYDGAALSLAGHETWGRYTNATYYNLMVNGSAANSVAIQNAGEYELTVSPVAEVSGRKFCWFNPDNLADVSNTGAVPCGKYTIQEKVFSVTGLASNIDLPFKNSDYRIDFDFCGAAYDGFVAPSENAKTIQLSLTNDDWDVAGSSVSIGGDRLDVSQPNAPKHHTVYYRVSAPNHAQASGSFTVTINRVKIQIAVSTTDSLNLLYADPLLDSDQIVDQVISPNTPFIFDATSVEETKAYLKQIVQKFVVGSANNPLVIEGTNYPAVGTYPIDFVVNHDWDDCVSEISFIGDQHRTAYVIKPRPVKVVWTQYAPKIWYDGTGGKRPTAALDLGEGDLAEGTTTGLSEVSLKDTGNLSPGKEAIDAGDYMAFVTCDNSNYIVDPDSLEGGKFTIYPRPIRVVLHDRSITYAAGLDADSRWNKYLTDMFQSNDDVYTLTLGSEVTDGKGALAYGENAHTTFTIDLIGAQYTDYVNGLRYFAATQPGREYELALRMESKNYVFTDDSANGKFTVNPAKIELSKQQFADWTYNGESRAFVLPNDNNDLIQLSGYEASIRSAVTIEYGEQSGVYASAPLMLKDAGVKEVYYRITAPNHIVHTGHVYVTIDRSTVYVDVTGQGDRKLVYGEDIPDSAGLIDLLGIRYYWSTDENLNDALKFDLSDKLEFQLLDGSGGEGVVTDNRAGAGKYSVGHAFINGEKSDNYVIEYVRDEQGQNKNVLACEISKRPLYVEWEQSGSGWTDGIRYTYDMSAPSVQPVAPDVYNGAMNVVVGKDGGRDTITLETLQLDGDKVGEYTLTTSLRQEINRNNYELVNPTQTFEIVKLEVRIMIKHQTAAYGSAKTVRLDTALIAPDLPGALWAYADGSPHFFSDHFSNYRLTSTAHSAPEGSYMDVGDYPITIEPLATATGEIVGNYAVTVVQVGDMDALFTITPAKVHYMGREFNIDVSNENGWVEKSQLLQRISTEPMNTPIDEFTVQMSDLLSTDMAFGDVPAESWDVAQTTPIGEDKLGNYYIWVQITHRNAAGKTNYTMDPVKISVNIWTDWVSVIVKKGVQAQYGDPTHDSARLFADLQFEAIYGIVGDDGANLPLEQALAELQNYVELFVGSGDASTPMGDTNDYGKYSIYFKVTDSSKYAHYRFLPYDGATHTSNIDAYTVVQRTIGINWGVMDEVYGDHSSGGDGSSVSNSHAYTLDNVLDADKGNVSVTVVFTAADGTNQGMVGGHVHDAGEYIAKVTAVSHPNYKLPDEVLECRFKVTPRPITVEVSNRTIVYGAQEATRDGINTFLNANVSGVDLYRITSGDIVSGDAVANIFRLKIGAYDLADGLQYLSANDGDSYAIELEKIVSADAQRGSALGHNYDITVVQGALTVQKSNGISFTDAQLRSARYNGAEQSVLAEELHYLLQGDGDLLKAGAVVSYKLFDDPSADYSTSLTFKNAGTYRIRIRIEAPNHVAKETDSAFEFRIEQAQVEISMTPTNKTYGDTIEDLLKDSGVDSFSDWLKQACNIQIKTYTLVDGKPDYYTVAGVDDDFRFKVIQKGQGNGDALEVGKNDTGEYRVYHENNTALSQNYSIAYYREPGESDTCNASAYVIVPRTVRVRWETNGAIAPSNNRFEYTGAAPDIHAYVQLVGEANETDLPVLSELIQGIADKEKATIDFNVGRYTAKVVGDASFDINKYMKNYVFANNTFDYEIVAKEITVVILNQSFVYGQDMTKADAELDHTRYTCETTLVGQPIRLTRSATSAKYYGVGSYEIHGSCVSDNYQATFVGQNGDAEYGVFQVTAAQIGMNIHTHRTDYNGNDLVLDIKENLKNETTGDGKPVYTIAGDMQWDDAKITYLQDNGTFADVKPVIRGVTSGDGVVVTFRVELANHKTSEFTVIVRVNPATLVVLVARGGASVYGDDLLDSDQLYDQAKITLDAEASSIKDLDLKTLLQFRADVQDGGHARRYNIVYAFIRPQDEQLYNVQLVGATDAYEITKRELTVQWQYTDAFVYNGNEHAVSATLVGAIGTDTVVANYEGNHAINAGTYTATAVSVDHEDYKLGVSAKLEWRIAPKGITVAWSAGDFTYDGNEHLVDAPVVTDGVLPQDSCDVQVHGAQINAGKHIATAVADNGNYTVVNAEFEFEIKQAALRIVWDEQALTYDGTPQAPTARVVVDDLIGQDVCAVVVNGAQVNAGEYVAVATLDNANYRIVADDAKAFAIAPKAITFTWTNQDDLRYTGEKQAPKAVVVGAVAGDVVEFEIDGAQENAGSGYIATVIGVKNPNYVIDAAQESMSTAYSIGKGINAFNGALELPETVTQLPWIGDDKPQSKWGDVIVKYYSDEACTQEVADIAKAGEGIYWIKAMVVGTSNYDEIVSQVFRVELQGGLNVALIVVGVVVCVALLAGALAVVLVTNKKKKQQGETV